MTLFSFISIFRKFKELFTKKEKQPVETPPTPVEVTIEKLNLAPNPRYQGKLWGYRPESMINRIIAHQALTEADTIAIHNYHISKTSHLKPGMGAPKIAYHYTIEKDGTIYMVNNLTDVTWHTRGQNMTGVGIMLCGDFSSAAHVGKSRPSAEQLDSLGKLFDKLTADLGLSNTNVYGHSDFGKLACPGDEVMAFIKNYKE